MSLIEEETSRLMQPDDLEERFERDFDEIYEALQEDINLLGDVQVLDYENGARLEFADFCRLNKLIKKYTHPIMVPTLKLLIDRRRAVLQTDNQLYRELAFTYSECEDTFTQRVSDVILEHFGID